MLAGGCWLEFQRQQRPVGNYSIGGLEQRGGMAAKRLGSRARSRMMRSSRQRCCLGVVRGKLRANDGDGVRAVWTKHFSR